jgi:hypothetical protein
MELYAAYMASGLEFPFEVGGPSSGSVIDEEGLLPQLQRRSRDPWTFWRRRTAI